MQNLRGSFPHDTACFPQPALRHSAIRPRGPDNTRSVPNPKVPVCGMFSGIEYVIMQLLYTRTGLPALLLDTPHLSARWLRC